MQQSGLAVRFAKIKHGEGNGSMHIHFYGLFQSRTSMVILSVSTTKTCLYLYN